MDISNIIKLAADPQNTELFLQVYYKLGTYLRKQDATKMRTSAENKNSPSGRQRFSTEIWMVM